MKPAKFSASVLLLAFLALVGQVTGAYEENAQAVRDLGVTKGEPIETGFVFWENRFIEGPYVVERRGVDILVNGTCVQPGPEYPAYVYEVEKDPGEPPPGSSPFADAPEKDPRDNYWSRKWRYLLGRFGHAEAKKQMVELYRRSPDCLAIYPDPGGKRDGFVCERKSGPKRKVLFDAGEPTEKLDLQEVCNFCEARRLDIEGRLKSGRLFLWWSGLEVSLVPATAILLMSALVSDQPQNQKLATLRTLTLFSTQDGDLPGIVAAFRPTDAIRKKVDRAKQCLEVKPRSLSSPPTLPNSEKRLDNEVRGEAELQAEYYQTKNPNSWVPAWSVRHYLGIAALVGGILALLWGFFRLRRKAVS